MSAAARPAAAERPGERDLAVPWAGHAVLLPALLVSLAPVPRIDVGHGIRAGQPFLDGAGTQRADTFTFSAAGLPWVNQQWLGQVLRGGVPGRRLAGPRHALGGERRRDAGAPAARSPLDGRRRRWTGVAVARTPPGADPRGLGGRGGPVSVLATPRLLVYMLMTLLAVLRRRPDEDGR